MSDIKVFRLISISEDENLVLAYALYCRMESLSHVPLTPGVREEMDILKSIILKAMGKEDE